MQELCKDYFDGLFDFAVGEREGVRRKPAPDAVEHVLDTLQITKKDAVYIGDSEVDVQTAINAGLRQCDRFVGLPRERTTRTVWRQSLCTGYERMPALVTIKRIGKEEKMRTKRKKQIIWEVIILFVLVAVAVGAVQFKRIHEQKMAEKNAVQKVKSVDDLGTVRLVYRLVQREISIQRIMPRKIKVPR